MQLEENQNAPPVADGENTAPAIDETNPNPPETGDGQEPQPEPAPEPEPAQPESEEKGKPPAWMQRRIDELTRARHDEARRAKALEDEIARLRRGEAPEEPVASPEGAPQTPDAIRAAAMQLRAEEKFNDACNSVFEQGTKEFPDFSDTLRTFQLLGGLNQPFLEAAIDAGNTHATLHHLGKNPEEAARIMALPERRQSIELARLSDRLAAPKPAPPLSKAPAPITPVNGNGNRNDLGDPDKLSTAEWMRRRDAGEI